MKTLNKNAVNGAKSGDFSQGNENKRIKRMVAKAEKTPKAVNYTAEQTAKMVSEYTANPSTVTVEKIALALGKTARSVVAKLSREKVYIAKVYKTKAGEAVVKKDAVADAIGAVLQLKENDIESLTKCTKPALQAIWKMLVDSKPVAAD